MPKIADEYLRSPIELKPGDNLHHLVALLVDTYYDDVTPERLADLERRIGEWRWCNAAGERVDCADD